MTTSGNAAAGTSGLMNKDGKALCIKDLRIPTANPLAPKAKRFRKYRIYDTAQFHPSIIIIFWVKGVKKGSINLTPELFRKHFRPFI